MSDKKKHKHPEQDADEIQAEEAVATPENREQLAADVEALKKQLGEAQAQISEYKDSWLRSQAEFQNYKKRLDRDNEMMYASMKGDIIKKVLPALDDLERAMQNRPADDAWANGIELIARKLQNLLAAEGLKKIEAQGAEFNPTFHEAISHEPADDVPSEHVIAVVQNGYMLGDRVIRPALVRVAQ